MSIVPWRTFSAFSLIASFAFESTQPEWSRLHLLGYFSAAWLVQFLGWAVWMVILYPYFFSPLRHLPQPPGSSLLHGQFKRIAKDPSGIPQRDWIASVPHNGLIRYLGLFNGERVLVVSPKALSEVLVTRNYDFAKPPLLRSTIGRILGVGVLLAEGDEHKRQRRNLMPAFAFRHVKELYPVFWQKGREVVEVMTESVLSEASKPASAADPEKAQKKNSAVIEAGSWASRVTLDIIGVAGLGKDFGAIKDPDNELNRTYQHLFKPSPQAQYLNLLAIFLPAWLVTRLPVKRNEDIGKAAETIRKVCNDVIQLKKEKLARKELTDADILSVALESGGFSDEDLINQLMTFLAAGHETTASAMTWATYMLCRFPEMQTRLRKEVRDHLPSLSSDGTITSMDIDHLPYLNAFANEVLRYYSPVPLTVREAAVDTSIQGQPIPKGTRIILCPWAVNFDKEQWGPDADKFDPERWIAKGGDADDRKAASGGASSNYAMLTFLHGPRSCIGQSFAKAEFMCLLATWVGRFEFELRDKEMMDEANVTIKGGITARPTDGLWVHATVVDGW